MMDAWVEVAGHLRVGSPRRSAVLQESLEAPFGVNGRYRPCDGIGRTPICRDAGCVLSGPSFALVSLHER